MNDVGSDPWTVDLPEAVPNAEVSDQQPGSPRSSPSSSTPSPLLASRSFTGLPQESTLPAPENVQKKNQKLVRKLSRRGTDSLKELVTCPICLERLCRPKMLPCQHTFCLLCLQNCLITAPRVRCPQCRMETTLPKEGVAALPANIHVQSILDLLESDVDESVHCSRCQTVCSVSLCHHCNNSYCSLCTEHHLQERKDQLGSMAQQLKRVASRIQSRSEIFEETCQSLNSEIHQEAERRIQKVRDKEDYLLKNVQMALNAEQGAWNELFSRLVALADAIHVSEEDFNAIGSTSEKVNMFLKLHQESSDLLCEVAQTCCTRIAFDPESYSLSVERTEPDDAKEDLGDDRRESLAIGTPPITEVVLSSGTEDKGSNQQKETSDMHSRRYRAKNFFPKTRLGIGLMQRPSGVAVSPWSDEVFVVSMDNHRILVFDLSSGKYLRSFGGRGQRVGEFLCPFGIALSPVSRQILVTDKWKHCIHVFDQDGCFLHKIGVKGRSPGHFRSPESICVDRGSGRIYVCDTCNNRVQVLEPDGAFIFEIGVKTLIEGGSTRQRSIFHEPTGIAVSPDGQRVVVCDLGNHRVHVFSASGDHLFTFGQKGLLKSQFLQPECVAVDNHGFIFVGDSGNGRVQICRPDGRFVREFGSKGSRSGQFSWISGIAITDNYDVVVSDFKNHCVQVF